MRLTSLSLLGLFFFGFGSTAQYSLPRLPDAPPVQEKPGIGSFMEKQFEVLKFMDVVGWDYHSEFEETGLKMQNLLNDLVWKNQEAYEWIIEVNKYFASSEFKALPENQKESEIFEAKLWIKMAIQEFVLDGAVGLSI